MESLRHVTPLNSGIFLGQHTDAKILCQPVWSRRGRLFRFIMCYNKPHAQCLQVYDVGNGTWLLDVVFWFCDKDKYINSVLPPNWTDICAPVILTGQIN